MRDPYEDLGLDRNATDEQVKKAYRTMAKKYHPDLNPGDKNAEAKMKEINEAYDRIKSGNTGAGQSSAGGAYGSYQGYNPYGSYGGYQNTWQQRFDSTELNAAYNYIRARHYKEALHILSTVKTRTGDWYYLSALANAGVGNRVTALEHARKAVEMDPANDMYVSLADQLEYGGRRYQQAGAPYRTGGMGFGGFCLMYCLLRMFCC